MRKSVMRPAAFIVLAAISTALGASDLATPHPCAAVIEPSERLACYDRTFPPAEGTRAPAEQAAQDFGFTGQEVRARNPALALAQAPDRIEATVIAVTGTPGPGRTITLDNGQTWRQTDSSVLGKVETGDRVTIKDAALSSYLLVTPSRVSLRVKRIK